MEKLIDFLNKMFKVLESTLNFVIRGRDIYLKVGYGGSYTNGKEMHIGITEEFKDLSLNIVYMMVVALIGHEGQHVLSSNFDEFKKYNEEEVAKLKAKGVSERFASHYVHSIGNIIEDGRIENILVNRLPGFIPKIQYLNMFFWNKREMTEKSDEFSAFISTILSLSVLGIYPKNYQVINGSRVDKEISKIKHLISKGVKATTCKDGLDVCREILSISEPFILDIYVDIQRDEEMREKIMELLERLIEEYEDAKEEDYNDSQKHSSHVKQEKSDSEEKDETESDSSEAKSDSKKANPDSKEVNSDSKEVNSDSKKDEEENKEPGSLSDGVGSKSNSKSDEDINEKMKELARDLEKEAEKDIKKSAKDENKKEKNKDEDYSISRKKGNEITRENFPEFNFREQKEKFPLSTSLPIETKTAATKFKRQIKDIFNSKNKGSVSGQEKGVLDIENIFRIGMNNHNVFKTEVVKNGRDHVLYFLRDGSGSMMGRKDMSSILSLAIMEEGLKGIVPFKAVTFYCDISHVCHRVIKDWGDNSKKNYAYNYIQRYQATGGNMDSVSIKIAGEELLKRPEKDKTLIVLSDGLPYSVKATKESIKYVRDKGVNVVGIMFGRENFRKSSLSTYKEMYQKNIIATSVNKIPNKLIKVLKETLKY